jgi:hypothetical protein
MHGDYSDEHFKELIGEPIGLDGYVQMPDGSLADVLVFACGCGGMRHGERYDLRAARRRCRR